MAGETPPEKALLQQICDEFLVSIAALEEFDEPSIERLKVLAASGELVKPNMVVEAIAPKQEEGNEASRTGN